MSNSPLLAPAVREQLEAARQGAFFRAFLRDVEDVLKDPASSADWVETIRNRVMGREVEYFEKVIVPGLDEKWTGELILALTRGGARAATALLCCLHLMPKYRQFLIADEVIKPTLGRVERKMVLDALEYLSPSHFFAVHLGPVQLELLRRCCPEAFQAGPGLDAIRASLPSIEAAAADVSARARAVAAAHRSLIEKSTSFDYGCGAGALIEAFSSDFEAAGGDLYTGSAFYVLTRSLAALRGYSVPEQAVGPDGRVHRERVLVLDENPSDASPPAAPRTFSVVTSNGVMEHVMQADVFRAVQRKTVSMLSPGGLLLLNVNPTALGHDGHHACSPWWGILLHRSPWLRRTFFKGSWREGFTLPVPRRQLLEPIAHLTCPPIELFPSAQRARERMGRMGVTLLPVMRWAARHELSPAHYFGLARRIEG